MKQNRTRYARNRHYSSNMKSMIKLILDYAKKGELDKANKILPKVVSSIDIAAKKNLIHKNNAAHKKSRVQRALNVKPKTEPKVKEEKIDKSPKKAVKKETKKEGKPKK